MPAEVIGWIGSICIVLAYVLVSFNIIDGGGITYQLLNLAGAAGILVIVTIKKVTQSIVLNVFWAVIALVALTRIVIGAQ